MPPNSSLFLCCSIAIAFVFGSPGFGQDEKEVETAKSPPDVLEGVGVVPKLKISRKGLPSFLTDEAIVTPHRRDGEEGQVQLEGVFSIGADSSRFAFFWDPVTCRLIGVIDLDPPTEEGDAATAVKGAEAEEDKPDAEERTDGGEGEKEVGGESSEDAPPSPFLLVASGPPLLASTAGGSGESSFFGVRIVEGKPEFLYQQGSLLVEERLWLEHGGDILQQHLALRDMDVPLVVKIPEDWQERVTADRGEWKGLTLTVPKEEANELRLTYRLNDEAPEEAPSEKEGE